MTGFGVLKRVMFGFAIGVFGLAVAACDGGQDVSTLGEQPTPTKGDEISALFAEHLDSVERLVSCLEEKGIETMETPVGVDGFQGMSFQVVMPVASTEPGLVLVPGVGGFASEELNEEMDRINASQGDDAIAFIDGGVDRTAQFAECVTSSGYFIPDPNTDPAEERLTKTALAEASNEWAQCARDNGFPATKDATVKVDGYTSRPGAVLPGEVTLEQLHALLERCPYVNSKAVAMGSAYWTAEEPPAQPYVHFDLPAGDARETELRQMLDQNHEANLPARP